MIFDTLKVAKKLRENGMFTDGQAEVMGEAFSAGGVDNLATKTDIAEIRTEIAELKSELKADIAVVQVKIGELRTEFRTAMKELEIHLLLRMGALFAFAFLGLAGIIHFNK